MLYLANRLAKSLYSAISADLGIVNGSNILTNEATLQSFTSNYTLMCSVLLANLVLLRALWSIMTFLTVHIVKARVTKRKTPSKPTD
jgi:hypothetical protein